MEVGSEGTWREVGVFLVFCGFCWFLVGEMREMKKGKKEWILIFEYPLFSFFGFSWGRYSGMLVFSKGGRGRGEGEMGFFCGGRGGILLEGGMWGWWF